MILAVPDWPEAVASLATHLTFAVAVLLLYLLPRLGGRTLRTCLMIVLLGMAGIHGVMAIIDTTILHLPPQWPAWPYWRRVIWRPATFTSVALALWWGWTHRLPRRAREDSL